MTLNQLRRLNKHVKIKGITNKFFTKYGRIVTGYDFIGMISYVEKKTPVPEEGVLCVTSVPAMEALEETKRLSNTFFGELELQVGYCNGRNSKLNHLQYHKSNQILVAVTDLIIFIGRVQDIKDNQYESSKAEIFFIPEGVAVELYSTALYSMPCTMENSGFRAIFIQARGTGNSLKEDYIKEGLLHSKNKWIIVHSDVLDTIGDYRRNGIVGENIEIKMNN